MAERAPLFAAIHDGDREALHRALAADPAALQTRNAQGISAVLYALYRGQAEIAKEIMDARPALDVFDAAGVGDTHRLGELLDSDPALVKTYASDGFTALHLAVFFGRHEAARLLLERGADVNAVARNEMRVMPLHSAVAGGHREICELLLQHGAEVNARQHEGWTPLHGAAEHGDDELVDMLLVSGADPTARMDRGQTPADTAAEAGHAELAARLRSVVASTT
jgi:ankyrin repeat protein